MSDHDDLRVRIGRLDPARSLDPDVGRPAPELMERIMTTPVLPTSEHADETASQRRRNRWVPFAAAAAVAAIAVTSGVALSEHHSKPKAVTTLSLTTRAVRPGIAASCILFSVDILRGMSTAFAGTVSEVDTSHVVLTVDHWYKGGTQTEVSIARPDGTGTPSLEGGVAFEKGKRYLVTATDGTVNGCGYSAEATPELEQSFAQAFGG